MRNTDYTDKMAELRRALGRRPRPDTFAQQPLDFDDSHLRRLVTLPSGERATPEDVWRYSQDLRYRDIDGPLLLYLMPACLEAWHDDLRGSHRGYGGFVEHFYPVLADRQIFERHLMPKQAHAVAAFMRQSILQEIDDQRGLAYEGMKARPYRWIGALTTYGVLRPDIERLWSDWWSLETIGRSIAAVQYLSTLVYSDDQNPVFGVWTPDKGGGPPCLWEFEGHLYEHRWLEPNVQFLRETLTASAVVEVLKRAMDRLVSEPEHSVAALVHTEASVRPATLEARCADLPRLLATTQAAGSLFSWSR